MQSLWLPEQVYDNIYKSDRRFIWGSKENNKRLHLVSWDKVMAPRNIGGLGIHPARLSNIAMLGKVVWGLTQNDNKLWMNMFKNYYLKDSHIFAGTMNQSHSYVWRGILKASSVIKQGFHFRVGKGDRIRVWTDCWVKDKPPIDILSPDVVDLFDLYLQDKDII